MNTQTFLEYLWQGGQYSYFWTTPDKKSLWFPSQKPQPIPKSYQNVYFGIHPTYEIPRSNARGDKKPPSLVRSQNNHISAVNTIFAEFDFKHFGNSKKVIDHLDNYPEPSVIIFSGGGYHLYWFLDKTFLIQNDVDRERMRALQANWVDYLKSDKQSKDIARVLRVPGTKNYKQDYGPNFPTVSFYSASEITYSIDFLEFLCETIVKQKPEPRYKPPIRTASNDDRDRFSGQAITTAKNMIAEAADGEKHNTLLKAARLLGGYIAGGILEEYVAVSLLEQEISNKANVADLENAKATIADGIEYGKSHPITLEQKMSEREEYFRQIGKENLYNSEELEQFQNMVILTSGNDNTATLKRAGFNVVGVNGKLTDNISGLFENCMTVVALSGPDESETLTEAVKQITARGIETKQCQMPFEPKNFFEKYSGTYQDMVSLLKLSKTVKGTK